MRQPIDRTGERYGRLVITGYSKYRSSYWDCVCDCGKTSIARSDQLKQGSKVSCGCWRDEEASRRSRRHGWAETPTYQVWLKIHARCGNPNHQSYFRYGGRGIQVTERWSSFENFLADMGERPSLKHTIERVNNNLGYEKSNCKWADRTEQARNRRTNHLITAFGETLCLAEWAEAAGIRYDVLKQRLKIGWPIERALLEEIRPWGPGQKKPARMAGDFME